MRRCHYCGAPIKPGQGRLYVKKDGTIYAFCSQKCRVLAFRKSRKKKWAQNERL